MARDEDLDLLKAIRLCAFRAVQKGDSDYILRFIFRWYSREFSTPLREVEEIPLDTILEHFFECRYEAMSDEERDEEASRLIETRAEREAREEKEKQAETADDDFLREVMAEAQGQGATVRPGRKTPKTDLTKRMDPEDRPPLLIPLQALGEDKPTTFAEVVPQDDPNLKVVPPEIKMEFISEEEMEGMGEWDLLGSPKPKK